MRKVKLLSLTMVIFLAALFIPCFSANAAEDTTPFNVPELSMTVDIPSRTAVITSNVKRNDPLFEDGTFEYISIMTKMREDSALLYGRNKIDDYDIEIISTDNKNHIKDLTKESEKKQAKLLEEYGKQDDIVESRIYSNGKMDFFFASRTSNNPSGRFFYCDYYTVYNGSDITIRIISSNDNIKDSELEIVKSVADSIRFPEKRKFSFSALNGKSVFVSFVIISVLFVLVVVYRRHDEKVNAFMMDKAVKLKQRIDKNKKDDDDTEPADDFGASQENESVSKSADNSNSSEPNDSDTEDDDLSSIDLDAAIALFDDSKK